MARIKKHSKNKAKSAHSSILLDLATKMENEGRIDIATKLYKVALAAIDEEESLVSQCAWCLSVKNEQGEWEPHSKKLKGNTTHGMCPTCKEEILKPELDKIASEKPHPCPSCDGTMIESDNDGEIITLRCDECEGVIRRKSDTKPQKEFKKDLKDEEDKDSKPCKKGAE